MSFIKHHFNNSHHCTAKFLPCFQNYVFEKQRLLSHFLFCKIFQKFKFSERWNVALVSFAKASQKLSLKIFSREIIISTNLFSQKGSQKSEPNNSKSVPTQTLQSGFWANKNQKRAYKSTSLFISN